MNKLNKELRNEAISMNLCAQWQCNWVSDKDKDELCKMYIKGIDFCIKNEYPSLEYLVSNFDGIMQNHGIYVSQDLDLNNPVTVVANGECKGKIDYDKFGVGNIYVRHNCELFINASGMSRVSISIYDNSIVHISQSGFAKVFVYTYSDKCMVEASGSVVVRKRKAVKKRISM